MANLAEDIYGGSLGVFSHRRIGLPGSCRQIFRDCHTQGRRRLVAQGIINDLHPSVILWYLTPQDFKICKEVLTCTSFGTFTVDYLFNALS